jgi:hypothetical protein
MHALLFAILYHRLWYALPLLVATSLVYGATRHERFRPIVDQAARFFSWMVVFMAILYFAVWLLSRGL